MSAKNPFDHDSLDAQVKRLPTLPANEAHLGVAAKDGDVGVEVEANKEIGKGWSASGAVEWMKATGWAAVAGLTWKKKP